MPTADRKLGVAICGVGWCASQHIAAFLRNPHSELTWLCARDADRARANLARYGIALPGARITTSYDEVLAAPDVDIVSIATPNHLHAAQAVAAARAGKHLLLEKPTGLDVDAARLLAKDWGLEFEHVPTTGASRIPALQTGKADLVISSLSYTAERAKVIDFSLGYAVLRTVIAAPKSVALKSLADLDGKTVGTVRGTTHDTQLTREGPKGMKLVRYEDDATETQAFLSGQVDVFSTAEMMVPQIDKKNPARQVELKFVLDNFKLAVGVKKDEKRLVDEVNTWISANLKNGRLNELNKKYFGSDLPELILKQ